MAFSRLSVWRWLVGEPPQQRGLRVLRINSDTEIEVYDPKDRTTAMITSLSSMYYELGDEIMVTTYYGRVGAMSRCAAWIRSRTWIVRVLVHYWLHRRRRLLTPVCWVAGHAKIDTLAQLCRLFGTKPDAHAYLCKRCGYAWPLQKKDSRR